MREDSRSVDNVDLDFDVSMCGTVHNAMILIALLGEHNDWSATNFIERTGGAPHAVATAPVA